MQPSKNTKIINWKAIAYLIIILFSIALIFFLSKSFVKGMILLYYISTGIGLLFLPSGYVDIKKTGILETQIIVLDFAYQYSKPSTKLSLIFSILSFAVFWPLTLIMWAFVKSRAKKHLKRNNLPISENRHEAYIKLFFPLIMFELISAFVSILLYSIPEIKSNLTFSILAFIPIYAHVFFFGLSVVASPKILTDRFLNRIASSRWTFAYFIILLSASFIICLLYLSNLDVLLGGKYQPFGTFIQKTLSFSKFNDIFRLQQASFLNWMTALLYLTFSASILRSAANIITFKRSDEHFNTIAHRLYLIGQYAEAINFISKMLQPTTESNSSKCVSLLATHHYDTAFRVCKKCFEKVSEDFFGSFSRSYIAAVVSVKLDAPPNVFENLINNWKKSEPDDYELALVMYALVIRLQDQAVLRKLMFFIATEEGNLVKSVYYLHKEEFEKSLGIISGYYDFDAFHATFANILKLDCLEQIIISKQENPELGDDVSTAFGMAQKTFNELSTIITDLTYRIDFMDLFARLLYHRHAWKKHLDYTLFNPAFERMIENMTIENPTINPILEMWNKHKKD